MGKKQRKPKKQPGGEGTHVDPPAIPQSSPSPAPSDDLHTLAPHGLPASEPLHPPPDSALLEGAAKGSSSETEEPIGEVNAEPPKQNAHPNGLDVSGDVSKPKEEDQHDAQHQPGESVVGNHAADATVNLSGSNESVIANSDANADSNADPNADINADFNADVNADVNADTDAHSNAQSHLKANASSDSEPADYADADSSVDAHAELSSGYAQETSIVESLAETPIARSLASSGTANATSPADILTGKGLMHPSGGWASQSQSQSLLEARQSVISIRFDDKDIAQQQAITSGSESIKNTFRDIKNTIGNLPPELFGAEPIDWEFWARVVEDYHEVVINHQEQLLALVAAGIPEQIRGIIWQLVAQSKNFHLEELYLHLKTEPSVHEKAIKKDLTRTSFYSSIESANKTNELYNVIAAYSNFDPDVGYTQGMVFIVVPLIINMTEAECFCLLVTLMKDYGLRQLFSPHMRGLHLLLYQYDRLLEQNLPLLYNHMCMQGIQLSMYASQWFLTFFSYKFPLDVVLRIFDMIITQGVEAVLRLGLNLVLRNELHLLRLSFDSLLDFLKTSLFDVYTNGDEEVHENKRFSLLSLKAAQKKVGYKLDAFITDLMLVTVNPRDLAQFSTEFDQMMAFDVGRTLEIARVKAQNAELRLLLLDVDRQYSELDLAHLDQVQRLVAMKVELPEIVNDITDLREAVTLLEAKMHALDCATTNMLPQDIEAEVQSLLGKNARETERLAALEEEFNELTLEDERLDELLKTNKKWFW